VKEGIHKFRFLNHSSMYLKMSVVVFLNLVYVLGNVDILLIENILMPLHEYRNQFQQTLTTVSNPMCWHRQ